MSKTVDKSFGGLVTYLQKIEDTPGKNDKLAILQELAKSPVADIAKEYFSIAMDWYRIYGLAEKSLSKFDDVDFSEEKSPFSLKEMSWEGFKKFVAKLEALHGTPPDTIKRRLAFYLMTFSEDERKWLKRALLKSLTIGVSEKTVNKVWPGLINFFEVQLADSLEDLATLKLPAKSEDGPVKATAKYWLEPKLDGVRAICRVNSKEGTVKFLSRGGQNLYGTYPAGIDTSLLELVNGDIVFDGELMSRTFNETMKVVGREDEDESDPALVKDLRFYVFDMLYGHEWDAQKCDRDYVARRNEIIFPSMKMDGKVPTELILKTKSHMVNDLAQLNALNLQYLNAGLEGVMIKEPKGLYVYKRSKAWLKFKPVETHDFKIIGVTEGLKKKTAGKVASLILDLGDGKTCEVGSGLSDEMRVEFMKKPPIGVYAEIKFKMRTPDGLLREPILVRMRPDKKGNQ